MLAPEVVFPGELPEDPIVMMRSFPAHRVDTTRLLIDEDTDELMSGDFNLDKFTTANKTGELAKLHAITPERTLYAARNARNGHVALDLAQIDLVLV